MHTNRNLPLITNSRSKSKNHPVSSRSKLTFCRSHFDDEDLQAHTIIDKYKTIKAHQSKKLRKIFNRLVKILKITLCDKFGQQLGLELAEIMNRMIYLIETQNKSICENAQTHDHPCPEYKTFIYQCMQKEQKQWNSQKRQINDKIQKTNEQIARIHQLWKEKVRKDQIIELNEKIQFKTKSILAERLNELNKGHQKKKEKDENENENVNGGNQNRKIKKLKEIINTRDQTKQPTPRFEIQPLQKKQTSNKT